MQTGNVSGDIHFHAGQPQPRAGGPTPRQLPADIGTFVNRTKELRQLDAILTGAGGERVVVSVQVVAGTAGAGKTSLALHWAHQVKDQFPDGQFFVNLRGYDPGEPVSAEQALRRFLRALGVAADQVPQDVDDAAALYRSLLADRRVLVVLDNAATVSQVRPLLPGGGRSLVIVTSRNRLPGLAIRDGARHLTLGTLPEAEAVALLRVVTSGYRPEDDEAKLTELAGLCARLPLALRIAAERAVSRPHMRIDDLIADLQDESALWDALSTGSDDEAEAVRSVFAWSYRALPPHSARLFRLLGLHPGPEFGLEAAAALVDLPRGRVRRLLDDLVGAHLLEQTAPDRFQFHDLLRAFAVEQAQQDDPAEERAAALRRVLEWYLNTALAAQSRLRSTVAHPVRPVPEVPGPAVEFADYDAAADWAEREDATLLRLVPCAAEGGLDVLAAQLAEVLWEVRPPSSPDTDWLTTGAAGLAAAERAGDTGARVRLLSDLGMACRQGRRLGEGLAHHRRALELSRAAGLRHEEGRSLNLIGLIHLERRELAQAADEFGRAAEIFRGTGEPRRAAMALSNTASTRLDAGHLPEAETAAREALAAHRALGHATSVGNALNILAEVHCRRGELTEARQAVDEALGIAHDRRDHTLEGFWLLTLGEIQRAEGRYGDALTSYRRSGTLHRRLGDRSREALAWRGTGLTYAAMGRGADAAQFHRQAAAVHGELGDGWQRALELDHLAAALVADDPDRARGHWAEALALLDEYTDPVAEDVRRRIGARSG